METNETVTYEWSAVLERLHYHRERLGMSINEIREYIMETYHKPFMHLSDQQIIELGTNLKRCQTKEELTNLQDVV